MAEKRFIAVLSAAARNHKHYGSCLDFLAVIIGRIGQRAAQSHTVCLIDKTDVLRNITERRERRLRSVERSRTRLECDRQQLFALTEVARYLTFCNLSAIACEKSRKVNNHGIGRDIIYCGRDVVCSLVWAIEGAKVIAFFILSEVENQTQSDLSAVQTQFSKPRTVEFLGSCRPCYQ